MCMCSVCLRFLFGGGVVSVRVFSLSLFAMVSRPPTKEEREDSLCALNTVFFDGTRDTKSLVALRRTTRRFCFCAGVKKREARVESADGGNARVYICNQLIGYMSLLMMMSVVS